jgi:hypothetical protein
MLVIIRTVGEMELIPLGDKGLPETSNLLKNKTNKQQQKKTPAT